LLDTIGCGQFGTVYKGIWRRTEGASEVQSKVAVKTLNSGTSEENKIKFLQEAVIMGQFTCLQILSVQGIIVNSSEVSTCTHCVEYA